MNPSTDLEILTYLKNNASMLSKHLPPSKAFTNRIRTHKTHLITLYNYWGNKNNYDLNKTHWKDSLKHFLENIYSPYNTSYTNLDNKYTRLTGDKIYRPIQGEKSDFIEEHQDDCHVCCEHINDRLSCGHWVCKSCIINSGKECCPLCRKVVSLNVDEVKRLTIIKEKNNPRRDPFSEHTETQEELLNMISVSLDMYYGPSRSPQNSPHAPAILQQAMQSVYLLRAWLTIYEYRNYSREQDLYIRARALIH